MLAAMLAIWSALWVRGLFAYGISVATGRYSTLSGFDMQFPEKARPRRAGIPDGAKEGTVA
jgi:hypothetical protein